ncbi:MAG: hypothetical protein ACI8W1_002657 [Candidatus Azotimanducaceae bacterium]|jgi:hypothetical protein
MGVPICELMSFNENIVYADCKGHADCKGLRYYSDNRASPLLHQKFPLWKPVTQTDPH